jgi:hypothetical protein
MANTPYQRGIMAATITIDGLTSGIVLESLTIKASGNKQTLTGNNEGQTVVDTFVGEAEQTADLVFETKSDNVLPLDLLNKSAAVSIDTDSTQSHTSVNYSFSGIVTDASVDVLKSGWHQYKITLSNCGVEV